MNAAQYDVPPAGPVVSDERGGALRRWWRVITVLLVAAVFMEAILAGAMLSGAGWARPAHALNAAVLVAASIIAGLVALLTLRRVEHGPSLGWALLSLAAALVLQAALGALSAKGANLTWAHVPLGVALVGLAARAAAGARRLDAD